LYDVAQPNKVEIGRMPDETLPACGVFQAAYQINALQSSHWISVDGRRAFFLSSGNDCGGPQNVYMREGGATGRTTLISGPEISGPGAEAQFLQATSDGSQAFFTSAARLDPIDLNATTDVYRHTLGVGNACLTCSVPDADVLTDSAYRNTLVAESGERVYFTSYRALATGAIDGQLNLYVWRQHTPQVITFVAPTSRINAYGRNLDAATTSDGSVLVFTSSRSELDDVTGRSNGGVNQRYRYDDRDGRLDCVSCPPDGTTPLAVRQVFDSVTGTYEIDRMSLLTPDGRSYFFVTPTPLVRDDVNDNPDIYEWRDGVVVLITNGRTETPSLYLHAASDDGSTVIFRQGGPSLTSDVTSGAAQLYAARVGGGFPTPPPAPVECKDDACQPRPAPPVLPIAGSVTFNGPGSDTDEESGERVAPAKVRLGRGSVRGSRITLAVRVPAEGTVVLRSGRTTSTRRAVDSAGLYRLSVRLTRRARRALRRRGRLSVTVKVSYRPLEGAGSSASVRVAVKAS
jgi:hypothetical protein